MTDPREGYQDSDKGQSDKPQGEQEFDELDIRPDDIDQVKGGARKAGDPCDGGEISKRLG